jgi:NitT/TauT family transport system ATP-binding protein
MAANSILEFSQVVQRFDVGNSDDATAALGPIDLSIQRNEIVALVGPSGCGKSTLLSIAAGLRRPTSGTALYNGAEIKRPDPKRGLLFQDYALFPWLTVAENISFGPDVRGAARANTREKTQQLVKLVNLDGSESKYPHELSGGMRQRCALARMLANDPEVLLLDEPLSALDAQTKIVLQEELLRIFEGGKDGSTRTAVIVTHSIEEAIFLADRVIVMSRRPGRVRQEIKVPFPRPRTRDIQKTAAYAELSEQIWQLIAREVVEAINQ